MFNSEPDGFSIDLKALKNHMESQFLSSILRATTGLDEKARSQIKSVIAVFERYGIGAFDAMDIMTEVAEIYSEGVK